MYVRKLINKSCIIFFRSSGQAAGSGRDGGGGETGAYQEVCMYACMYVCVYVCMLCMFVFIHVNCV